MNLIMPFDNIFMNIVVVLLWIYLVYTVIRSTYLIIINRKLIRQYDDELAEVEKRLEKALDELEVSRSEVKEFFKENAN